MSMDELRQIARAHYEAGSDELREMAHDFFNSMDDDGDQEIDFDEFLVYVGEVGHDERLEEEKFFDMLDSRGYGNLDFWDVMTLYYIVRSKKPFCDMCDEFIPGTYFVCSVCFNSSRGYFICLDCFHQKQYQHTHSRGCQFLDNFSLLEAMRESAVFARQESIRASSISRSRQQSFAPSSSRYDPSLAIAPMQPQRQPPYPSPSRNYSSSSYNNASRNNSSSSYNNASRNNSSSSYNNAIVPASSTPNPRSSKWKAAYNTFERGLTAAAAVSTITGCSIL